jgi:hypothetical protein
VSTERDLAPSRPQALGCSSAPGITPARKKVTYQPDRHPACSSGPCRSSDPSSCLPRRSWSINPSVRPPGRDASGIARPTAGRRTRGGRRLRSGPEARTRDRSSVGDHPMAASRTVAPRIAMISARASTGMSRPWHAALSICSPQARESRDRPARKCTNACIRVCPAPTPHRSCAVSLLSSSINRMPQLCNLVNAPIPNRRGILAPSPVLTTI